VISQTCDLRRDTDLEPFVQVSPILGLTEEEWRHGREGTASTRRFAYPHALGDVTHPVLDVRIVQTVEKTALVAETVAPMDAGLDHPTRLRLSAWLARRFARHAFPDELETVALRRLREELAKRRAQPGTPAGALLDCREAVMVSYGDGPNIDVLFVVRQDRVVTNPVFAQDAERKLREGADAIMRPVVKRAQSQGSGYTVTWEVATLTPSRSRRSSTATTRSTSASRRSRSLIGRAGRYSWSRSVLSILHKTPAWDLREVPQRRASDRGDTQTVHCSQRMQVSAATTAPASPPG